MVFLPKPSHATGVWERQGLPPWRPITVQSSLATRLLTAISCYLETRVPNHPMQHGFQRDKNVQDAALATTLLLDRAVLRKEPLYLLSKNCEKCYDRIPRWVMAYIYKRIGVPKLLYDILMGFLGPGEIDIRTAFGWVSSGTREFGLGQGSVLSIRHIGYYMDVLMQRQDQGPDAVIITHSQGAEPHQIASTVLVDDVIDVATTRSGIEHRVAVSNVFTGIHGTGGVFGASKSFLLQYTPTERSASATV
ncbi:hypothetical protein PHYSODRAFT_296426 [Phytophthora sojae]|uniref:Reverse transcriptase domain-containing protein n=1 Tax=Phytophthora sojae (strain P6497) TaxID=1094619 RepID=G4YUA6_PHYSP|nr:hypothetical protein PHYSODRAFT_296426 [Phytophthora sojae]EGZ24290.1 hypothetical protein PHYSODRAFT_296426 [Phytophthora sojae]|eukprot:XP_009519578.1 hypothetical protein PHYSODRAFT_296426 [Phytophthora sojae]